MTSYLFASNSIGKGARASLNTAFDGAYVMAGVGIGSTDNSAILGLTNFHSVTVEGVVTGHLSGIHAASRKATKHDLRVSVAEQAKIYGYNESGIDCEDYASSITNHGTIYGKYSGIKMTTSAGALASQTFSSIVNTGEIRGLEYGIIHSGAEELRLVNSGKIEALTSTLKGTTSFSGSLGGRDIITNNGEMTGNIFLGGGADRYDGRKGHVSGAVSGQDGDDQIYGGTEDNSITGGKGNDFLSGGAGSDTFIFNEALSRKTNVDTIADFTHGTDEIVLFNFVFRSLGVQTSGTSALPETRFKDLGVAGAKVDGDDRVLYNRKTGDLFYDDDGAGGNSSVRFAHCDNKAVLTAADFSVFSIAIIG